ncbi:TAXI family TRAP transporter solute-binding subunit [Roseateles sp. PN1]|uniref:TAXI family TRAP transporter solute-binding subunit n=1 Tax=Roseateles sp. PN1 TaxID=3137372 RepID=UPI003138AD42
MHTLDVTSLRIRAITKACTTGAMVLAVTLGLAGRAWAAAEYKIVTASDKGTYYAIGKDLAKFVAPDADVQLEVVATSGSAANVKLLRYEPGVKLAVVQADVFQAFVDRAGSGNNEAAAMVRPLRVILPLYNTEIHYIVRADSPLNYIHDIKDAKINGGLVGSGAALITHTLYRMMFNGPMPEPQASFMSNEEALVKLISDKSVDVVVVAAGQPAPLIANMRPEAQKFIKLLKFDPDHPASKTAMGTYTPAKMLAASYPNLLSEDFTTISVGAFLVTYDYNLKDTISHLARFGRSLCQNFSRLQADGHPKWREVSLKLPELGNGWAYFSPTARELRTCAATKKRCSAEERILGLCN